jgi:hypothetical protein
VPLEKLRLNQLGYSSDGVVAVAWLGVWRIAELNIRGLSDQFCIDSNFPCELIALLTIEIPVEDPRS